MKRASLITLLLLSSLGALNSARAMDYPLPPAGSRLIGQNQTYTIQEGDNKLQTIARRFNTAAQVILETNNTIAPVNPAPGTVITIPSQMLLPDTPREDCGESRRASALLLPAGREHRSGFSAGYRTAGAGNAGDDHAGEPEDPESHGHPRRASEHALWSRALNCLRWCLPGQITRWDASHCV